MSIVMLLFFCGQPINNEIYRYSYVEIVRSPVAFHNFFTRGNDYFSACVNNAEILCIIIYGFHGESIFLTFSYYWKTSIKIYGCYNLNNFVFLLSSNIFFFSCNYGKKIVRIYNVWSIVFSAEKLIMANHKHFFRRLVIMITDIFKRLIRNPSMSHRRKFTSFVHFVKSGLWKRILGKYNASVEKCLFLIDHTQKRQGIWFKVLRSTICIATKHLISN